MSFAEHDSAMVELMKIAARKDKKQLQKDLNQAKDRFNKSRTSLVDKERMFRQLGEEIKAAREDMGSARKEVLKTYDVLKNMDLLDLNEVRMVGDDVGYVKNQRIYRLEDRDGELELTPWRKKMEDQQHEEEFNPEDLFDALESLKG
jgi:hypothetical protein